MASSQGENNAAEGGPPSRGGFGLDRLPWWVWAVLTVFLVFSAVMNIAERDLPNTLWGIALLWAASGAFNAARRRYRGEPS